MLIVVAWCGFWLVVCGFWLNQKKESEVRGVKPVSPFHKLEVHKFSFLAWCISNYTLTLGKCASES